MKLYVITFPSIEDVAALQILLQYSDLCIYEATLSSILVEMSEGVKNQISQQHPELIIEENSPYEMAANG